MHPQIDQIQKWIDKLYNSGGEILDIDFTQYYINTQCDPITGQPLQYEQALIEFKKCNRNDIIAYQNLPDHDGGERFRNFHWIEKTTHILWLSELQSPIIYKPTVVYSEERNQLRLAQGNGRAIALHMKNLPLKSLYFHYPGVTRINFENETSITTAEQLLVACRFDNKPSTDLVSFIEISKWPWFTNIESHHTLLSYATSGELNIKSQRAWQNQALQYYDELTKN